MRIIPHISHAVIDRPNLQVPGMAWHGLSIAGKSALVAGASPSHYIGEVGGLFQS